MSKWNVDNERVVDELTSGLEACMQLNPEAGAAADGSGAGTAGADPTDMSQFNATDGATQPATAKLDDQKEFDTEHEDKSDDEDYVDEEALKDTEVTLTEDQREERKIIAEELKNAGNDAFKHGDYQLSIEKYTEGLRLCPLAYSRDRAILYCNRAAARMKLEKYAKAVSDCTKSIELDERYTKAYIRRAQSYESTDKLDECLADYNKILELDPSHSEARAATIRLPPLIEQRNEKLKTEMMGKLKELGNMILKPFGLSTANFQVNQDPNSKGYSINFKQ